MILMLFQIHMLRNALFTQYLYSFFVLQRFQILLFPSTYPYTRFYYYLIKALKFQPIWYIQHIKAQEKGTAAATEKRSNRNQILFYITSIWPQYIYMRFTFYYLYADFMPRPQCPINISLCKKTTEKLFRFSLLFYTILLFFLLFI